MKYIFVYPDVHGTEPDLLDSGSIGEVAATAEAAGWDGFALTEHPIPGARWLASGGHQTLDPFVALGCAAAVTSNLCLLTYLSVVPYRNPFLLAKAAATVDKLSAGRFVLGVGAGYQKSEFHALGVDFDERNRLVDEALDALPLHWSGQPFSYQGLHFDARDVIARPRPVQDPIPIWIGGNSRATLRRVAERAQGWMPLTGSAALSITARTPHLGSTQELSNRIAELRDMAGDRGDQLDIVLSHPGPAAVAPGADVDRHKESLAELERIGATWVVVSGPAGSAAATFEFLQAFGATYLEP